MFRWTAILLVLCLSACNTTPSNGGGGNGSEKLSKSQLIQRLQGVKANPLIRSDQGNCAVDAWDIPGQGWRVSGSSGGLTVVDGTSTVPSASTIDSPETTAKQIMEVLTNTTAIDVSVGVLVVDDFDGTVFTLGKGVYDIDPKDFTALSPEARADALTTKIAALEASGAFSHGALVLTHLLALFEYSGQFASDYSTLVSQGVARFFHLRTQAQVTVRAVDTDDFNTDVIASRIQEALVSMLLKEGLAKRAVVNMSFAIVPCGIRDDFKAAADAYPTFEAYADAVADANAALMSGYTKEEFGSTIKEVLVTELASLEGVEYRDNLRILVDTPDSALRGFPIAYVASAGNYALPYAMYPAAWPKVISASSHDIGAGKSVFSNSGEVMEAGAWHTLTDPANLYGGDGAGQLVYAGTSYSSPNIAFFSALDFTHNTPVCPLDASQRPALAHGAVSDLFLNAAIAAHCP